MTASPAWNAVRCPCRGAASAVVRARHSYTAASVTRPMTVLQCTVKLVTLMLAPMWRKKGNPSASMVPITCVLPKRSAASDHQVAEEEHQHDERDDGDDQRAGEQRAEQLVVVLEVHVEHDDDRELHGRHDQQRRHEHG